MTGLAGVEGTVSIPSVLSMELRRRVVRAAATILRVPPGAISDTTLLTGSTIDDLEKQMGSPMQLQFGMQGLTVAEIVDQYTPQARA